MTSRLGPVVERHRDLTQVHLGPTQHDLAGDASDREPRTQVSLGGAELAARAKQVAAPLERACVACEISGFAETTHGATEQHLGGIGTSDAKLFAPEDVVRESFDPRGA